MTYNYFEWLKNPYKIFCECKCGEEIIIKEYCKQHGIPKYIHGHNKPHKGKTFDKQYRKKLSDACLECHNKLKKKGGILEKIMEINNDKE